jgi:hypothetical protein
MIDFSFEKRKNFPFNPYLDNAILSHIFLNILRLLLEIQRFTLLFCLEHAGVKHI